MPIQVPPPASFGIGSKILEDLIEKGRLLVVGAEYSPEAGVVEFFDGLPEE